MTTQWLIRIFRAFIATLALVLASCGGGGGGGGGGGFALNSGPVSGTLSSSAPVKLYTFNVVADTAYTVSVETTSGDTIVEAFHGNLSLSTISGGAIPFGWIWNSTTTTPYNTISFVATTTETVTVAVIDASFSGAPASYNMQAYSGDLTLGKARPGATYSEQTYWSFDATAGTAYKVRLTPRSGNVNIGAVYPKLGSSVGSSSLSGTVTDTVTFQAAATQRYYVRVNGTSTTSTFDIQVDTTSADPDLSVSVDSAVSDGANVTVNYTVHNGGINAASAFDVQLWSNAASAPTVGATGEKSVTIASLAGGASTSGSVVIPNTGASGTAYAMVDSLRAVTETDETNNVSVGVRWDKPLIAPQSFDFENNTIPTSLKMSGNASWTMDATTGSASTHSLKAGSIGNSQQSCVTLAATNAQSISFDYAVSSELYGDYLNFYIDDVPRNAWSGTVNWTSSGTFAVTYGLHTYKWCYSTDFSGIAGANSAWIDNIVLTAAPPPTTDLSVAITSAVSNGSAVTINYTVTNSGNTASGPFDVDFWGSSPTAPLVGAAGPTRASIASLSAGATVGGTVSVPTTGTSGTAYAIVDTANVVVESNETNNVSAGYAWTASIDLSVVVTSAKSDRNIVTINYTVTNGGANTAGSFRLDVWSNAATAPTVGMTGENSTTIASLASGASTSGSLTVPNTGASGTAYAIVDTSNTVAEGVETNNVSAGLAWTQPVLAPVSYNFDNSLVPAEMLMSGNAPWLTATVGKGANALFVLKAGTITHGQTTCVAVNAANSYSVSFSYSVSSESGFDFLRFYIDGVQQAAWSGSVAWTTSSLFTAATVGVHEFKWCYTKDGSVSSGSDTVWIDNIVIN